MLPEQNINTNNNVSQTLFRFVSLRNPQLTETHPEKNLGFVHLPKDLAILFAESIPVGIWDSSNGSKISALENQISVIDSQNSNYFYKTKSEVVADFLDFFPAAEKIAKNELENISNYLPESNTFPANYAKLWDNLIYQVLTQKDFYVKEAILQVIKAIHFCVHQNNESHILLRDAKVVMPGRLFVDTIIDDGVDAEDVPNVFTVNESLISNSYIAEDPTVNQISDSAKRRLASYAEKNTKLALAVSEKGRLDTLKTELDKVTKNYHREYSKAYNEAQADYQALIKPLLDDYQVRLKAVTDGFNSTQTPEEQQALLDAVSEPVLPEFQFEFPKLDTMYLKDKLTEEAFLVMADVLHKEFLGEYNDEVVEQNGMRMAAKSQSEFTPEARILPVEDAVLIDSLHQFISLQYNDNTEIIQNSTSITKEEYTNLNGMFVPIQTPAKNPFTATLTPKKNYRISDILYDFDLALEMSDVSWEIESMDCYLKDVNGNTLKYSPKVHVKDGVKILTQNIFNDQFSLEQLESFTEFRAMVYFKNDKDAEVIFTLNELSSVMDTKFSMIQFIGQTYSKSSSLVSTPSGSENITNSKFKKSFVPKGFGIRRLGIADYLKVEQSIHAYVPGEISNIENVMASELRHKSSSRTVTSEITDTTKTSTEKEHVSDTTVATRNEMQSEISKMKLDDTNVALSSTKWGITASFANHRSKEESTRQAVTKAQEVTNKALDRIVSNVEQERIQKIINTYTEMNVHEFDNRGKITATTDGESAKPQHITGVYRWVDKKMKNQIYNYGKRLMFEFMIPQPAKLHENAINSNMKTYTRPLDPRNSGDQWQIGKQEEYTFEKFKYWADYYKTTLNELPQKNLTKELDKIYNKVDYDGSTPTYTKPLEVPENYVASSATIHYNFVRNSRWYNSEVWFSDFKNKKYIHFTGKSAKDSVKLSNFIVNDGFIFEYNGRNIESFDFTIIFDYTLSKEFMDNWYKTNLASIITKYNDALEAYQKLVEEEKAKAEEKKESSPLLYREIEQNILKHNAIAYMVDQEIFGTQLYTGTTMKEFAVLRDKNLDDYASLVKFMEQAFEWEEMSYEFYPYYWGSKEEWPSLYQSSSDDAQFRAFLQSGMARVVATVRPGFEDAVTFYMSTGKIWNGGEVPVIGDPMYLSVVDEMKETTGKPQGKYWITRVPTSLTILQAKSVGLEVTDALPIFPETDVANCENPEELVFENKFTLQETAQLQGNSNPSTLFNYAENLVNLQNNQG